MELTLQDLKNRLANLEETYLIEILNLTSEDLVEVFGELIESNFERLCGELEEGFDITSD